MSWPLGVPVDPALKTKVLAVLRHYWDALEGGKAGYLMPSEEFAWKHYEVGFCLETMRERLDGLDLYLSQSSNVNWANTNSDGAGLGLNTGPGMSRLPDAAVIALFQELDAIYVEYGL